MGNIRPPLKGQASLEKRAHFRAHFMFKVHHEARFQGRRAQAGEEGALQEPRH